MKTQGISVKSTKNILTEEPAAKPKKADPRKKALTQIQRSSGAIVGSLLGGVIASLVGRRLSYFLMSLATFAVSTFLFTQDSILITSCFLM